MEKKKLFRVIIGGSTLLLIALGIVVALLTLRPEKQQTTSTTRTSSTSMLTTSSSAATLPQLVMGATYHGALQQGTVALTVLASDTVRLTYDERKYDTLNGGYTPSTWTLKVTPTTTTISLLQQGTRQEIIPQWRLNLAHTQEPFSSNLISQLIGGGVIDKMYLYQLPSGQLILATKSLTRDYYESVSLTLGKVDTMAQ
ncbi:hypothetical protein ACWOEH_12270 [Enterococcus nangangensis]